MSGIKNWFENLKYLKNNADFLSLSSIDGLTSRDNILVEIKTLKSMTSSTFSKKASVAIGYMRAARVPDFRHFALQIGTYRYYSKNAFFF